MEPIHPGEILMLDYIEPLGITQHRVRGRDRCPSTPDQRDRARQARHHRRHRTPARPILRNQRAVLAQPPEPLRTRSRTRPTRRHTRSNRTPRHRITPPPEVVPQPRLTQRSTGVTSGLRRHIALRREPPTHRTFAQVTARPAVQVTPVSQAENAGSGRAGSRRRCRSSAWHGSRSRARRRR